MYTTKSKTVIAYTDGGCFGNPGGPGAWGYLLKWPDGVEDTASGGHAETTNNREELKAIRECLKAFRAKLGDSPEWNVVVRSDSEYAIKTVTGAYKRRANLDLFPEIDSLLDRRVSFEYVRGHASDRDNNRVHDLVQAEIDILRHKPKDEHKGSSPDGDVALVIKLLRPGDEERVVAAADLFDRQPGLASTRKFLADQNHHILMAYVNDQPAGFVTGVEMTHPDKGTEMFLYELSVSQKYRQQGIGKALVTRLRDVAREQRCQGMWVLTESDNVAAVATYRSLGGKLDPNTVLFEWVFG